MKLYISTLGVFDIKLEDTTLIKDSSRSYRLYKLLQYFITFRNKKILADTIIENIWPDHKSYDPYNMLRAQIYRLRQLIRNAIPEHEDPNLYMSVNFTNGYYSLDIGERTIIDIDEFVRLIALGDDNIIEDNDKSIEYYEEAINLYKGSYLEECEYELWIIPVKNYYNSLYSKTLFKLIEILEYHQNYSKIIDICQNTIIYEPQNELLHIHLMEAMLKMGQIKDAQSHYEYASFLLDKDGGLNLSIAFQDINRKIQNQSIEKSNTNISSIRSKLEEENDQGPFQCDFQYFKFLFNIKSRKRNVDKGQDYITIITLKEDLKEYDLKYWSNTISNVLKGTLRQGDVYTFWNELQILVLLQNVEDNGITGIEDRIKDNLNAKPLDRKYDISIKSTSLVTQESLI